MCVFFIPISHLFDTNYFLPNTALLTLKVLETYPAPGEAVGAALVGSGSGAPAAGGFGGATASGFLGLARISRPRGLYFAVGFRAKQAIFRIIFLSTGEYLSKFRTFRTLEAHFLRAMSSKHVVDSLAHQPRRAARIKRRGRLRSAKAVFGCK